MSDGDADHEDLRKSFEGFADWCVGTSPLYERLARGVAESPELLALAAEVPEGRSPPHLLLAAVHYLLLGGSDHPLSEFYPSVTDGPRDPTAGGSDPVDHFQAFCHEHRASIEGLVTNRRTQTNSVRRSAALYPAFAHLAGRVDDEPLSLVEVGPSAGLNLLFDRYAYEYDLPDGGTRRCGHSGSPVTVDSAVRAGDPPLPSNPPPIDSRVGIDLYPLDPANPDDARWLQALVWPEHDDRHRILRGALAVAREDPPSIREGDALELLAPTVADVPDDRPVCVFGTQVLYQFPESARDRFLATVRAVAQGRSGPLYWLSGERAADGYDRGIELRLAPGDDADDSRVLLVYEQHGRWIAWTGDE